ncbi:hypothetical protein DRN58_06475 [Thermococci archaeon]|nr:MAG: hypothetical protein DRN50_03700 [Thermococci archaeon]RLF98678.1 MAG: hypothetical protein DRN58_06475 [Thermococci archaeon]
MRYFLIFLLLLLLFPLQGALIKNNAYECDLTIFWNSDRKVESLEIYVPVPEDTDSQTIEMVSVFPEYTIENGAFKFIFEDTDSIRIDINFRVQTYTQVQEIVCQDRKEIEDSYDLIDYENTEIVAKAKEITKDCENDREKVKEIFNFVQNLDYEYNGEENSASWALRNMKGDCTEFSFLFIALCKASGIEARPVWGWLPRNSKVSHSWAEFYLGRWYPIDPTEKNFHVFEPHIAFNRGFIEAKGNRSMDAFAYYTFRGDPPTTYMKTELKMKEIPYWTEKKANYLNFSCDGTAYIDISESSAFFRVFPSSLCFLIFALPFLFTCAVIK